MTRSEYETEEDRAAEEAVAKIIGQAFSCEVIKIPKKYGLDRAAVRENAVVSFLEIKCRKVLISEYKEIMLSLHKVMVVRELSLTSGKLCLVFFKFIDALVYCDVISAHVEIRMGGRTDRGDPDDIEPLCFYPTSKMKKVNVMLLHKGGRAA